MSHSSNNSECFELPVGRRVLAVRAAAATLEATQTDTDLVLIPGGKGKAVHMKKGDKVKVINTHGVLILRYFCVARGCGLNLDAWLLH